MRDVRTPANGVRVPSVNGTDRAIPTVGKGRLQPTTSARLSKEMTGQLIAECAFCTGAYYWDGHEPSPFCSAECESASTGVGDHPANVGEQPGSSRPKHIVCSECWYLHPVKSKGVVPKFCSPQCRRRHKAARFDRSKAETKPTAAGFGEQGEVPAPAEHIRLPDDGSIHRRVGLPPFSSRARLRQIRRGRRNVLGKWHAGNTRFDQLAGSSDRRGSPRSDLRLLRRTFREARPYRLHIAGLFVLSLLSTPLALLAPVPLAVAVDSAVGAEPIPAYLRPLVPASIEQSPTGVLLLAAALLVAVALLTSLQYLATSVLQIYTGEKLTLGFQGKLLHHVQRLSFTFHDGRGTADSIHRIQYDASSIQNIAVGSIIPFVTAGFTLVAMLVIILRIDRQLALVALAVSPFLFGYARFYRTRMRPKYKNLKRLESSSLKIVQEVLTSFRVVKAFGREDDEGRRFVDRTSEGADARIRLAVGEGAFGLAVNVTTAVGTAVVLYVGMSGVQAGTLTLGSVLLVLSYVAQLYGPLKTISNRVASLQRQLASAERSFDLLDEAPDVLEIPNARSLRRAQGHIEFRGVSFSYDGQTEALQTVSFTVPPGSKVGVIGKTGAGKTTLVSLLTRFYDPGSGSILLDGIDVRRYKLRDLRSQFTIMLQEPVLFSTSIVDNVAYAKPDASFEEVVRATKAAGAHEFVSRLPDGYDTVVGERGMRLSGGERQRISLARAFLKDAPVLILDEPTSSVDVGTEAQIMEAMDQLMKRRTTFIIAHRLGTVEGCDLLVELEGGAAEVSERRRRKASVQSPSISRSYDWSLVET